MEKTVLDSMVNETTTSLVDEQLISVNERDEDVYEATLLGQAIVAASLTPEDGLFVHDEFKRALQSFVMDSDMHIFYLFTPINLTLNEIDWPVFRDEICGLDDSGLRVLQACRVNPGFVNRM